MLYPTTLTLTLTTPLLPLLLLFSTATALPTSPAFTISNFTAFIADPYVDGARSNLTFSISDARPGYEATAACIVPNTYFSLYAISALFDVCAPQEVGFRYSFGERGLTVQRDWWANGTSYVVGSGMQEWGWKEEGEGKNVTKFPEGKLYVREEEWVVPVRRVAPGMPPR